MPATSARRGHDQFPAQRGGQHTRLERAAQADVGYPRRKIRIEVLAREARGSVVSAVSASCLEATGTITTGPPGQ